MQKKHHIHHLWLMIGAYGVWFAILSGLEEILSGKLWKTVISLILGFLVYIAIEFFIAKKKR